MVENWQQDRGRFYGNFIESKNDQDDSIFPRRPGRRRLKIGRGRGTVGRSLGGGGEKATEKASPLLLRVVPAAVVVVGKVGVCTNSVLRLLPNALCPPSLHTIAGRSAFIAYRISDVHLIRLHLSRTKKGMTPQKNKK